jgi:Reverse transcriptase (RNA-dependent DNA polymerase).
MGDIVKHKNLVDQAKLEELKRWHDLKCFKRMSRASARNKVGGTWVLKWKKVRKEINGVSTCIKLIKARLTARGFKDVQAFSENVTTYSGTASKCSQRMISQHAAHFEHQLFSMDISAAFSKGMTYGKIAEITGEPLRSVQLDFPRQDAWLLQQLPGMQDFDYHTEVLDLVKALWGLKDAPRAFGLKLAETLRNNGYTQGIMDPQIWRNIKGEQKGSSTSRSTRASTSEQKGSPTSRSARASSGEQKRSPNSRSSKGTDIKSDKSQKE